MTSTSDPRLKVVILGLTTGLLVMLAIARLAELWWWRANLLESADARGVNLASSSFGGASRPS